ncbi:unannotated protein [freshwater metagenome]|uniref:Unannotated protein n=1 Tax=freshwater metagenome TaxID=449393 RepID=A0A6J6U559_9ZZZZ
MPEALLLRICLDECDLLVASTGEPQIADRCLVDREDRNGAAVLGAHVAQRGAIGQRHLGHAPAVELHELAHHAMTAEHLGDREDEVGCCCSLRQFADELESDDPRYEHRHRLTEHRSLGLDAADSPAKHAEAVDHRRMGIGADDGVGIRLAAPRHDDAGEMLDVHLVDDAGARGNDLELLERTLSPAEELVPLAIALVLEFDVALLGVSRAEEICDDGVVDDELRRGERLDSSGIPA